jgi:hypothetical protein
LTSGYIQYWCVRGLNCVEKSLDLVLTSLIKALDNVSSDGSFDIASCILDRIFDGEVISETFSTVEQLSDKQRTSLQAIANSRQFWTGFSENCIVLNVAYLLESYGLPTRPEQFQAFLNGEVNQLPRRLGIENIPF